MEVLQTSVGRDVTRCPKRISCRIQDRQSLALPYAPSELAPDLAEVVAAWPALPEPIRAGILATIRALKGKE